jgi:hypothetical protein
MDKYFINQYLFSSSFDTIRNSIGGFWSSISVPQEEYNPVFKKFDMVPKEKAVMGPHFVVTAGSSTSNSAIKYILFEPSSATTASSDLYVPSIKIPVRIYGEGHEIENDEEWRTVVLGGNYGNNSHPTVFSNEILEDTSFNIEIPYDPKHIKSNDPDNASSYTTFKFTYDYNYYLKEYQQQIEDQEFFLIPSYYFMLSHQYYSTDDENEFVNEFMTRHGEYETDNLLSTLYFKHPPLYDIESSDVEDKKSTLYSDREHNMRIYLTSSLVNTPLSGGLAQSITNTTKNYFFNRESQTKVFMESLENKHILPYYTKLHIPIHDVDTASTPYYTIFETSDFEPLLLNSIKQKFVDERDHVDLEVIQSFDSFITSSGIPTEELKVNILPKVNVFSILVNSITDANNAKNEDFQIIGAQSALREKIVNQLGVFRYSHTIPAMNALKAVNRNLSKNTIYNAGEGIAEAGDFFNLAKDPRHSEILAYRIRKIEGDVDVDFLKPKEKYSSPQERLSQNFIISKNQTAVLASSDKDGITLYDTQVKYGQTYTYICYAYVLVEGYKYTYKDLVISKQIAYKQVTYDELTDRDIPMSYYVSAVFEEENPLGDYCLSFHDPYNDDKVSPYLVSSEYEDASAFVTGSDLFTSAQLISSQPYLADFNLMIEPSLQIYEVPLYKKSFKVLDHPLQAPEFYTYQRMDNSQVIGFLVNLESFVPNVFPHTITKSDFDYKVEYLNANDLLETEEISIPCRSRPSMVEVFRKRTKPLYIDDYDISDFANSKTLNIDDRYMFSNCVYEERVPTNTKLYYVLRFASQNNTIGQISAVVEAELVNDGNYKYSVFNQYFEDDFEEIIAQTAAEQFKKLFKVAPTISQLEFDQNDIDYSLPSTKVISNLSVGSAGDTIFDKTFKFRLTSKKTGKKIDLNVTYRLREEVI